MILQYFFRALRDAYTESQLSIFCFNYYKKAIGAAVGGALFHD